MQERLLRSSRTGQKDKTIHQGYQLNFRKSLIGKIKPIGRNQPAAIVI